MVMYICNCSFVKIRSKMEGSSEPQHVDKGSSHGPFKVEFFTQFVVIGCPSIPVDIF